MGLAIFGFFKRPQVDEQNTGRDVYERPFSVGNVGLNGSGGFANFRSLSPVSPTSLASPLVTTTAISGTGNNYNTNPDLNPLSDRQSNGTGGRTQF